MTPLVASILIFVVGLLVWGIGLGLKDKPSTIIAEAGRIIFFCGFFFFTWVEVLRSVRP